MNAAVLKRTAFAVSACGGFRMEVAGQVVTMRSSGALWIEAAGMLIVADLHFEKGSAYAVRGQLLPPYDTGETIGRIEAEVAACPPRSLVFLGDSFHDGKAEDRLAGEYAARLAALASGRTLVWVTGNHDEEGPKHLPGEQAAELAVGALALRHEPTEALGVREAAGHLHPCAKLIGRGRAIRRRCFVTDGERMVLPAFGAYAGGLNVRDKAIRGLFDHPPLAIALGQGRVHPLDWSMLGAD